jgi:hypothetical protein
MYIYFWKEICMYTIVLFILIFIYLHTYIYTNILNFIYIYILYIYIIIIFFYFYFFIPCNVLRNVHLQERLEFYHLNFPIKKSCYLRKMIF